MARINKKQGVYAIEIEPIKSAYIGQSIDIVNRFGQHKSVFGKGKAINKQLQADWNKYKEHVKFTIVEFCAKDELYTKEKEVCKRYIENGWRLYNTVITTETNILNAPKEYLACLKKVIQALDSGKISVNELITSLERL